jgi:hypothetical protein
LKDGFFLALTEIETLGDLKDAQYFEELLLWVYFIGGMLSSSAETEWYVPRADEIKVAFCHQDEVPQTPVTPVSAEGLASLHNLIKQDAHTLDGTSIQRVERHLQKLANTAQASFAKSALLYDQNQLLIRMNNESKVRRLTNLIVLGKAKVMSFEDIEVARAARAAKDVIKGWGKRGRKRKSATQEADEPEPEVARMI